MEGKISLLVLLLLLRGVCYADLTPISSSVAPGAQSSADNGCAPVNDAASESQGATLNPLAAYADALSVCNGATVNTYLAIAATWTSASKGSLKFTNVGWKTSDVSLGWAYAFQGTDYTYNFVANENEPLTLHYGSAGGGSDHGFGLNGFYAVLAGPNGSTVELKVNTSGTVTWNLVAGSSYSLNIYNRANIWGPLHSITDSMNGEMYFSTATAVPEASTFILLGSGAVALLGSMRRKLF